MTKTEVIAKLRILNKHYDTKVRFRTGYPNTVDDITIDNCPCADYPKQLLIFPPEPIFYDLHVLAHEYAHILDWRDGNLPWLIGRNHQKSFLQIYKEVCLVLGIFADLTVSKKKKAELVTAGKPIKFLIP